MAEIWKVTFSGLHSIPVSTMDDVTVSFNPFLEATNNSWQVSRELQNEDILIFRPALCYFTAPASGVHRRINGIFDGSVFKVILRSLGAFPIFNNYVSRARLLVEQTRVEFGTLGYTSNTRHICIWAGAFDLVVFKVILGSFGSLLPKWPVTWKQCT